MTLNRHRLWLTDHRALFINCVVPYPAKQTARSRCKATFYNLWKHHIDALAAAFNECNWSSVSEITDVDLAYERFLSIAETLISLHIPQHTVTMPDNTPRYITPLIKSLLRKRNKLIRNGRITDVDCLSLKIEKLVTDTRAANFLMLITRTLKGSGPQCVPHLPLRQRNLS